jgi:glycosyltransferase involved in cell wall biosynthesis
MAYGVYISINLISESYGGALVGKTNYQLFKDVVGNDVCAIAVNRKPIEGVFSVHTSGSRLGTVIANMFGLCATLTRQGEREIYERVRNDRPSVIWLDSSLFGRLIPRLRIESPGVKIVCFFHNLEEDIVLEKVRKGQWVYYLALAATRVNERKSAKLADVVVTIQEDEAIKLLERYGRKVDFIFPVCMQKSTLRVAPKNPYPGVRYVLFVGSDFPPNVEALHYLSKKIAPQLENTIVLAIGKGLEKYDADLGHEKLKILGFVPDLAAIYYHAVAVVAPIFSGGGMKVKIAEALMHGKYVIGSKFAFIGYENAVNSGACKIADSEYDYIDLVEKTNPTSALKLLAQDIFMREYSLSVGATRMKSIINFAKDNISNRD